LLSACIVVSVVLLYRGYQITRGHEAFERLGCASCHMAGGAPSLEHVGRKYDRQTFVEWVTDPETIYARLGRRPLNRGYEPMPRLAASHSEIQALSYFLSDQR
jgi:mono/diheme cytochrome c family protein